MIFFNFFIVSYNKSYDYLNLYQIIELILAIITVSMFCMMLSISCIIVEEFWPTPVYNIDSVHWGLHSAKLSMVHHSISFRLKSGWWYSFIFQHICCCVYSCLVAWYHLGQASAVWRMHLVDTRWWFWCAIWFYPKMLLCFMSRNLHFGPLC